MTTLVRQLRWDEIDEDYLRTLISNARNEDLFGYGLKLLPPQSGDLSSNFLPVDNAGKVVLRARQPLVACGLKMIPMILQTYHCQCDWQPACEDGDALESGAVLGTLGQDISSLLVAERVLLNFLQKLSGIATLTHRCVAVLKGSNTRLLDTRKTTPGYRILEKYAVACGGGWNHRLGLYDRIMFKDNHLAACGGIGSESFKSLIQTARSRYPGVPIEVEIDHLQQLPDLLKLNVDGVLLDNFSTADLHRAVTQAQGKLFTEASGGITLERLQELASIGLDFISTGSTVHQATWVDIGLDWQT